VLARLAQLGEAGGLAAGVGQRRVAPPAPAAAGQLVRGAGADQVGHQVPVRRLDDRAVGDAQGQVGTVGPVPVVARAALAVLGLHVRPEVEVEQGVDAGIDHEADAAAVAAVTAVRAAEGPELLAQDRYAPVPAVAGLHVQHHAVHETGHDEIPRETGPHE
jgi:hypothetical protein